MLIGCCRRLAGKRFWVALQTSWTELRGAFPRFYRCSIEFRWDQFLEVISSQAQAGWTRVKRR